MEWIPRSPGLYHTQEAKSERQQAGGCVYNISDSDTVYEPEGKLMMVRGGVGCFHLAPKEVSGESLQFLSASSSGVAHKGFIIALRPDLFSQIDQFIGNNGGFTADLQGEIRYLYGKDEEIPLSWRQNIPRTYLLVENLTNVRPPKHPESLDVTAAVTFGPKEEGYGYSTKFTYSHFNPANSSSIDRCVNWIEKTYVGDYQNGVVLTDFDETRHRFSNTIFSLQDLMNPDLSHDSLEEFFKTFKVQENQKISQLGHDLIKITK